MALKIKPLPVARTTENGITTNEPKGSNANSSKNNSTEDLGFMQYENLFIFADFPCQPHGYWEWGWKAVESNEGDCFPVAEGRGMCLECNCGTCLNGIIEVTQYYSLIEALRWLVGNASKTETFIFVGSEEIEKQVNNTSEIDSWMLVDLHRIAVQLLSKTNAKVIALPNSPDTKVAVLSRLPEGDALYFTGIGEWNND